MLTIDGSQQREVLLGQTFKDQTKKSFFKQNFGQPKTIHLNVGQCQRPQETRYYHYKTNAPIGKWLSREIIERKLVWNPKEKNVLKNFIREGHTTDTTHSEKMASFIYEHGYMHSEWPSVVIKLDNPIKENGNIYLYALGPAGHHREDSLDILGAEYWMYDVYAEMNDSYVMDDASIQDNGRLQTPQLDLTKYAIENKIVEMVNNKRWEVKTEDDLVNEIKEYLKFTVPNIHPNTRAAIARSAVRKTESTDWINYTPDEADKFIDTNTNFKHSGEFDEDRGQYGWTVMDGYFDKRFFQALMKFEETGNQSYSIGYGKTPKVKSGDDRDIRDIKIEQFKKIEKRLENGLDKVFEYKQKHGKYPSLAINSIIGYLPQDRKKESLDKIVNIVD